MKRASNVSGMIGWGIGVAFSAFMLYSSLGNPVSGDEENTAPGIAFMLLSWTSMFCIAHVVQLINNNPEGVPDAERFGGFLAGTFVGSGVLILSYITWGVNMPSLATAYILAVMAAGIGTYITADMPIDAGSDTCE